jgi:hypothetical protein
MSIPKSTVEDEISAMHKQYLIAHKKLKGDGLKAKEIIDDFKEKNPKYNLTPTSLSNLNTWTTGPLKDTQVAENLFRKIVNYFVTRMKDDYNLIWNTKTQEYIDINSKDVGQASINAERLEGLSGVWKVYTWNKTKNTETGKDYINIFKIEIDAPKVIGETKNNFFESGTIELIAHEKIAITLITELRRICFVGRIGSTVDLNKMNNICVAYIDSGNDNLKSGIAVIEKV